MMPFVRTLGRIVLIAVAATFFAGLTFVYSRTVRPRAERREFRGRGPREQRDPHPRPTEPRPGAFPVFLRQCGVFAVVTLAGRKILRLRL